MNSICHHIVQNICHPYLNGSRDTWNLPGRVMSTCGIGAGWRTVKHSRFLLNLVLVFALDGGAFALSRPYYRLHPTWKSIRHKESFTSCKPANLINFIITIFSSILMFSNTGPPNSCRNSQLDPRGEGQLNRIVYNGAPVWKSILHSPRNLFINARYPSLETEAE